MTKAGNTCPRSLESSWSMQELPDNTLHGEQHQNGVAKCANHTLEENATALLTEFHLPASFWGHAITTLVHVQNRSPTAALGGDIPYTCLYGKKPNMSHLKVLGCTAYVHIKKDKCKRLSSHTEKCVFISYPAEYKGMDVLQSTD